MSWFIEENMNWSDTYDKRYTWTVDIPEGQIGEHSIVHYTLENEQDWHPYFVNYANARRESLHLKKYTVLLRNNHWLTVMQDSFTEFEEHQWLWGNATGDILVTGLGIGYVNEWLIKAPNITSVTIIEKNQDVIDLVWDNCTKDDRFTLIHADANTWEPPEGTTYDCIWLDHEFTLDEKESCIERYSQYGNVGTYGTIRGLDNYYEINEEGMLEIRTPNKMLDWM